MAVSGIHEVAPSSGGRGGRGGWEDRMSSPSVSPTRGVDPGDIKGQAQEAPTPPNGVNVPVGGGNGTGNGAGDGADDQPDTQDQPTEENPWDLHQRGIEKRWQGVVKDGILLPDLQAGGKFYYDPWGTKQVDPDWQSGVTTPPASPFGGPGGRDTSIGGVPRHNYDPEVHGMPQNYAEATIAMTMARKYAPNIIMVEGVGWVDSSKISYDNVNGVADYKEAMATAEQVRMAMLREEVKTFSQQLLAQAVSERAEEYKQSRTEAYDATAFARNQQAERANEALRRTHEIQMAQTQDKAARDRISMEHDLALQRIKKEQEFDINLLTENLQAEEARATRREDFEYNIQELRFQHEEDAAAAQNQFVAEENAMNRALAKGELDEAKRHAIAMEGINREQLAMQEKELKLDVVSMLGERPEMFFFGQETGLFSLLGDVMGDGGELINSMVQDAQEDIDTQDLLPNIQEYKKMSNIDQRIELFRIRSQKGLTEEGAIRSLRGAQPFDRSGLANLAQSIGPGSAATRRQFPQLFNEEGLPTEVITGPENPWAGMRSGEDRFGVPRTIVDQTGAAEPIPVSTEDAPSPQVTVPQGTAEIVPNQQITMVDGKPVLLSDLVHLQSRALTVDQATAKIDVQTKDGRNTYRINPRKRVAV
jgi:hypothetical protein